MKYNVTLLVDYTYVTSSYIHYTLYNTLLIPF